MKTSLLFVLVGLFSAFIPASTQNLVDDPGNAFAKGLGQGMGKASVNKAIDSKFAKHLDNVAEAVAKKAFDSMSNLASTLTSLLPWRRKNARIEKVGASMAEEKAKLLALLNVGRRHFADKFQIANMHALEMSQELSIVANRLAQECAQDAELMSIDEYEVVPVSLRQPSRVYTAVEIAHLGSAFLNNPIVTKVGFAKVGGCERDADIGYSVVFVLSSSVREKKKPFEVQYGEPGSACSDGFRNLDGLCVLV